MAIVRYAGNRLTGVSGDTKPTSNLITGTVFQETNTDDLYIWDGDSWNIVASNTGTETLSNKTFSSHITVAEISAPSTPSSGYGAIYAKSDNKLYFKNDGGTEVDLTNQASGGETNQNAWNTVAVSGQDSVVADSATDTLTLAAGSNVTLTTNASNDTVTIASSGSTQNLFQTVAVSGEDNVVADSATDTLTLAAAGGMTITTNASNDTITFSASGGSTVTVTDNEAVNENNLLTFVANAGTATGAHGLEMDGDLHYNPSTGTLTSTVFAGALTGNASGTSATVTGAAQTAITSVGTLTGLDLTAGSKTIFATVGANTLTIGASGTTISIPGNLTVSGTTTTVSTTNLAVEDSMIALAAEQTSGTNADALDVGFYGTYRDSSTTKYAGLFRDVSDSNKWKFFDTTGNSNATPGNTVDTTSGFALGDLALDTLTVTSIGAFTATGAINFGNQNMTNVDIDSGAIDGATIGASSASTVVATQVDVTAQGDLRLQDTTGGQYVGFQAPGTVSSSVLWTLPSADGTEDYVLATDGSGVLSWAENTGGGGTPGGSNYQVQYNNSSAFGGASNVEVRSNTLALKEQSAPSAVSGYGQIYAKTDNNLYYLDDGGTESQVSGNKSSNFFGVKAYLNADLNISNASATVLGDSSGSWTEVYDVGTWHDASTNPDRINFPTIGYYLINLTHRWAVNSTGYREIKAIHTSGGSSSDILLDRISDVGFTTPYSTSSTVVYASTAADYLTVSVYQSSGGTLSLEGGTDEDTSITISRLDHAANNSSPAVAKARLSTATTAISHNTETALVFNADVIDTNEFHDTSSNTHRFTVPSTGYYLIKCKATLDGASGDANYDIRLRIKDSNGDEIAEEYTSHGTFDTTYVTISVSGVAYLAANAWVAGYLTHTRDANTNLIGGTEEFTFFEIVRLDGNVNQSVSDLTDTTITSPADASLLIYDTGTTKWRDGVISGDATMSDAGALTIAANAVEGSMLNANTVDDSSIQLASNTLNVKASGVTNAMLANSTITMAASTGSSDAIALGETFTITAGEGIDTTMGTNIVTIAGEDATTSNKGIASFATADFAVSSGAVTIKTGGVTSAQLAGSVANAKLTNSSITIGGTAVALGGTITALTALTDLDLTAGAKTIFDTVGANDLTIGASNTTVVIAGNLTVSGDTTTVNTATVSVEDPLMALANGNTTNSVDIGFYGKYRTNGTDLYTGLVWDGSASQYILFHANQAAPTTTVNTGGTGHAVSTLVANLTGTASVATEATNITAVANNSTNETVYPTFVDGATGTQGLETDTGLTYNPSTGTLTSTTFAGALTGNITGQVSTASQTSITSIANLATVGTIGTGIWNGTAVITTYGGTGLASYTAGDIVYYASGTTLTKLAKGTATQVLAMNSGATAPEWADASTGAADLVKVEVVQSSHGFAVGDVLKSSGSDDTYAKAQADSAANAEVMGIVQVVTDSNNFTMVTNGHITTAAAVPNSTAGTVLFLSPSTAGALTTTEPTTEGQISKPVAIVTNANDSMLFANLRGKEVGADAITTEKLQSAITQSSHGFAVGDIIRSSGTNGQYTKAIATTAANAEAVGIVVTVTSSSVFSVAWGGIVDTAAAVPNVAAGSVVFLSAATAGELTATEPSTAGQISKPFAVITNQNTEMFILNLRGEVISSAGANAPADAQYLTLSADSTLTGERVLTAGNGIALTDAGANGAATVESTRAVSYFMWRG